MTASEPLSALNPADPDLSVCVIHPLSHPSLPYFPPPPSPTEQAQQRRQVPA